MLKACLALIMLTTYHHVAAYRTSRVVYNINKYKNCFVSRLFNNGRGQSTPRLIRNRTPSISKTPEKSEGNIILYHKPIGMVRCVVIYFHDQYLTLTLTEPSSIGDPWNRRNLEELYSKAPLLAGYHPVGRLDADTSGLLLFSNDGKMTQKLLSPKKGFDRVYECIVMESVNFEDLSKRLLKGIETTDGIFSARLIHSAVFHKKEDIDYFAKHVKEQEVALNHMRNINKEEEIIDDDEFLTTSTNYKIPRASIKALSYLKVAVNEGKHRMVRRILHNAGHSVLLLHRCSYGSFSLTKDTSNKLSNANEVWPPRADKELGSQQFRKATIVELHALRNHGLKRKTK